ncbi:MAG TPA: hypothetical protein VEQ85_15530, partial [Lacipirellulaceae bacterium]|nr:hypothetical protein [Lacipirellulaceae bacterium]
DNRALGFKQVELSATAGGADQAWLTAAGGAESYTAAGDAGTLAGPTRSLRHAGVETVHVAWPAEMHPAPQPMNIAYDLRYSSLTAGNRLALGIGVAYPWKLLADPANPGTLLAITGEGEQGGASLLYRLDAQTLAPIGTPLAVGSSASDIAWVGRTVAVAARSSAEVILVDVDSWRVLDDAAVFQDPIAVTAMGANRFAVASIRVKELQIFRTAGGVLTLERKIALPGIAYDVQYDAQYERLYVNQPALHAIIEIDAASGLVTRQHQVGGEPSYGGAIMGRYYVASDRDGYVHFIDRATGAAGRYDLHAPLGLDRATAALRGIDPTDVVVLDDRNLVVVNNRQDSLLLSFDAHAAFQAPTVRARFTGAAFGAGVAPVSGSAFGAGLGPAELLVTTPALHRIDRVRLVETNGQVTVSAQTYIVGVSPVAAVRLGTGPGATLAVLASNHTLRLVSEFDGTAKTFDTLAGHYVSARHPMAADREGRLWLICNGLTGRRLVAISAAGELLVDVPAPLSSPFSIAAATDTVVVIDRTHKQALEYDVPTGVGSLVTLSNDRPRHAEILARGEWIVIHDTNPDLGVTHSINGVRTFTPYIPGPAGRWLASSTLDAAGRPILLDFNGRILSYDVAQRKYQPLMTLSTEPAMVATFGYGRLWVVSPADSTVALIRPGAATPEAIWTDARAFDVIPAEGGAWLVTTAGLVWRKVANAAWWL